MVTLLIGENSFEIERALGEIASCFDGRVEKIDGSALQLKDLPDILMGVSLFATERVVVIRGLGQNKSIWPVFGSWLDKISDDIHLVLVEPKPDKRTVTFKALKDAATIRELQPFSDRDVASVEKWVTAEAKKMGLNMDNKCVQALVNRVGFDQWQLFHALQKLALVDNITVEVIADVIDLNPFESVFNLFETALRGDRAQLKSMLRVLEQSEDVFRLIALLLAQVFQLAAISSAERTDSVAKDFGIHPFVVSKLSSVARKVGVRGVKRLMDIFVNLDDDIKVSKAEPWVLVESALLKVAKI
ncbi:MAG: DNA polymerase III subunit delta [Candidatus Saccharibacteria bacterium]